MEYQYQYQVPGERFVLAPDKAERPRVAPMFALGLAAIVAAAAPATARADIDAPSAALDHKLVIEDEPAPEPAPEVLGIAAVAPGPPRAVRNHELKLELITDYGIEKEEVAGTTRVTYTYKPWWQLRFSAAGARLGFGDDGLTQGVFSAGVGFQQGERFSWRITGLVKVAEQVDPATMATSAQTTPGIDGVGRLALPGGKLVLLGQVGVRFSDPTAVIGAVAGVVPLGERFGIGAQLASTVIGGDAAFEAALNAAAKLRTFELGLTARTPVDGLAVTVGAYLTYTYSPAR